MTAKTRARLKQARDAKLRELHPTIGQRSDHNVKSRSAFQHVNTGREVTPRIDYTYFGQEYR